MRSTARASIGGGFTGGGGSLCAGTCPIEIMLHYFSPQLYEIRRNVECLCPTWCADTWVSRGRVHNLLTGNKMWGTFEEVSPLPNQRITGYSPAQGTGRCGRIERQLRRYAGGGGVHLSLSPTPFAFAFRSCVLRKQTRKASWVSTRI